jgi:ribonuclease P protein component
LLRLKTRAQFQAVLAGTTVAKSAHFALHRNAEVFQEALPPSPAGLAHKAPGFVLSEADAARPADAEAANPEPRTPLFPVRDLWIGAMVPKRWAKRAVTRNAIKRQIYTVSADFSPPDRHAAYVVRLRRDFSRKTFVSASSDALKQAVRLELIALMQDGARAP